MTIVIFSPCTALAADTAPEPDGIHEGYYEAGCGYYNGQITTGRQKVYTCNNLPLNSSPVTELTCNNLPLNANYQKTKTCTLSEHSHNSSCYSMVEIKTPVYGTLIRISHTSKNGRNYYYFKCYDCGYTTSSYDYTLGGLIPEGSDRANHTCIASYNTSQTLELTCDKEEHTHGDSCYTNVATTHEHTDSCYTTKNTRHTHSSSCYHYENTTTTHYHNGNQFTGTGCYSGGTYHRYPASFGSLP